MIRLAGGNPRVRAETAAYQPLVLDDGTLIGVRAEHSVLHPQGGSLDLLAFPGGFAAARSLLARDREGRACAPAALSDRRVMFSYDRRGDGDFGIYCVDSLGDGLSRIVDLPGTLELDAAVLAARPLPPIVLADLMELPHDLPPSEEAQLHDLVNTFRFDCLNVFANAGVDVPIPDAPPPAQGLKIRFYAALARPGNAGGDTVVLVRESPVDRSGAVHEHQLPADVPMFEQLIDAHGRVIRSASGPAHVPGFNAGRFGTGTKCVGCHIGHSVIPVARSAHEGKRFNASPSATAWASSALAGSVGAGAIADRRARGPAREVAWVAETARNERVRLTWSSPIAVDSVVIYAISPQRSEGTDLRVEECEVLLLRNGREVRRNVLRRTLSASGTRIGCGGVRADAVEVRPTRVTGKVHHRAAVALAEIETRARLLEN
jgi:hypothetical protein